MDIWNLVGFWDLNQIKNNKKTADSAEPAFGPRLRASCAGGHLGTTHGHSGCVTRAHQAWSPCSRRARWHGRRRRLDGQLSTRSWYEQEDGQGQDAGQGVEAAELIERWRCVKGDGGGSAAQIWWWTGTSGARGRQNSVGGSEVGVAACSDPVGMARWGRRTSRGSLGGLKPKQRETRA
jgi:hypothetical protein